MTLAHQNAAHGHQGGGGDAEFLGPQQGGDDDVAPGADAAVGTQLDGMAQAVEGEHLVDFGKPHFPRRTGVFDAR